MSALTVAELARLCGGVTQVHVERVITGANTLELAGPEDLSFVSTPKAYSSASHSGAGCLIVATEFNMAGDWSLIRVLEPRTAFAKCLTALYDRPRPSAFVHPSAVIADTAELAPDCYVGAYAVIGERARIGAGCYIGDQTHIGEGVIVGERTTLQPHVTIYHHVQIGARVILHAGSVVGADGFGFVLSEDHYENFPQVGTVRIEDDVEIGANTCIDRAALGVTLIGAGTKLDNLVHIAHNCKIGKHVVIAAQTGFAGGVIVEDYAVVGGQVGAGEKARIASKAVIGSKAGILSFQHVKSEEPVWGIPARPVRQHLKGLANITRIPALREQLRRIESRLHALEGATRDEN